MSCYAVVWGERFTLVANEPPDARYFGADHRHGVDGDVLAVRRGDGHLEPRAPELSRVFQDER